MNRHEVPSPKSAATRRSPPSLNDLPVVRLHPPPTDEDRDLDLSLADDAELAAHYRDLETVNQAIMQAHELLAAPTDDPEAGDHQPS